MWRSILFMLAVCAVYTGGFAYDELGPVFYGVVIAIMVSTPLLLKLTFWKKILWMIPLLIFRVIGKVFLTVFGKNALSRLLARYGLLEQRFNRTLATLLETKDQALARWHGMSRQSQAYLILIFLPVAVIVLAASIIVKIVRLKFLQFIIEKIMQKYLVKFSGKIDVSGLNVMKREPPPPVEDDERETRQ